MRFFPLLIVIGLGLLTYGLSFMVDTFPTLDRLTSFATLSFVSFGAALLILTDGIHRAKSGRRVGWNSITLAFALLLTIYNLAVWMIGEVAS